MQGCRDEKNKAGRWISMVALTTILTSACAIADDFAPPAWRGQDGTTYQQWTFSTSEKGPMSPDEGDNIYGDPQLRVVTTADWEQGAWPLVGQMDALIPNRPGSDPGSYKEIWIQLTWKGAGLDDFLWDEPFISIITHPAWDKYEPLPPVSTENDGWINTLFKIKIWPNPYEEMITLKGDIIVDQIVIDTHCIPEPATLLLLGFGLVFCLKRKRGV